LRVLCRRSYTKGCNGGFSSDSILDLHLFGRIIREITSLCIDWYLSKSIVKSEKKTLRYLLVNSVYFLKWLLWIKQIRVIKQWRAQRGGSILLRWVKYSGKGFGERKCFSLWYPTLEETGLHPKNSWARD
jgi:hypothetical protein